MCSLDADNQGVILEKLLVTDRPNFKRFLNSSPPESVSEAERNEKEAYRYSKVDPKPLSLVRELQL
jgi:hypothetical protein